VNAGGPVLMPWRHQAPAVLLTWFGGQEYGSALADVLLGDREPGGRLPTTWPARQEDVPVLSTTPVGGALEYREGVHIGYRAWARAAAPAYSFGHGLGYTTWSYGTPRVSPEESGWTVTVPVANTGSRPGKEVVQLYVAPPVGELRRPVQHLGGFAGVHAAPGETVEAVLTVDERALRVWDPRSRAWTVPPGDYLLRLARSSRNAGKTVSITVG